METSQHHTLSRMHSQLRVWQQQEDPRATFLDCYSRMTAKMLDNINQGRFEDPLWVEGLLHKFGDYYFNALTCYHNQPDACPRIWKQAHDETIKGKLHVMQALLVGVNAHINYDLVFCLVDCLQSEWSGLEDQKRSIRSRDHDMVNEVIGETIDEVQDEVIERQAPYMDLIDRLAGRWDERFLKHLISHWRDDVWDSAIRLVEARDEAAKHSVSLSVEDRAAQIARWVLVF